MKEIIFFSNNKNKIDEVSNLFKNSSFRVLNLNNFKEIKSPKESGNTFKKNAKIKALFGLKKFKKICFADDSGICINAMNKKPGVSSKEFLNLSKDKTNQLSKIIDIAKNKKNFLAYFQTTICLSLSEVDHVFFTGKLIGKISKKIKGGGGFGYDPIFIPNGYNITLAEMSMLNKNKISHRGIAISKLKIYLNSI